jgi:thiamine-phosphate pyrophosphorylase
MRGGADILQLRHKTLPRGELLRVAMRMRALTTAGGALFIVNDYADIAIISGADGVHLGHDDMSLESARQVVGASMLIGASASKPEDARAAHAADYIGSGPVFSTPMKAEKGVIDPAGVAAVASAVNKPVFAIGGIDELNLVRLTALGIRRACVIRAVADASDPQAVTRRLRAMLDA